MKSKPIPQFPTAVLMLVTLFSVSLVSSGASNWTVNHQSKVPAVPTVEVDIATQTPAVATILLTSEPVLSPDDPTELFTPDQISGGLQTTVTDIKWGTDSAVASMDSQPDSGWSDVTVSISVKCILKGGCQNISVLDYDLAYDKYVGDLVYGAQQEFGNANLKPDETVSGSITFAIPSTAKTLALRYAPKPMVIAEFSK